MDLPQRRQNVHKTTRGEAASERYAGKCAFFSAMRFLDAVPGLQPWNGRCPSRRSTACFLPYNASVCKGIQENVFLNHGPCCLQQLHLVSQEYGKARQLPRLESQPGGADDRRGCATGLPASRQIACWRLIDAARGPSVGSLPSPDTPKYHQTKPIQAMPCLQSPE